MTPSETESDSPAIDWERIRKRLQAAQEILQRGFAPSPAQKATILRQRAKALSAVPAAPADARETLAVLVFELDGEPYALELSFVREVYPLTDITPLPGTPPFVLGIINVRGEIFSVVNLKTFFGLPNSPLTPQSKAIILESEAMSFAILADATRQVQRIPIEAIQPPPATLAGLQARYVRGVTNRPLTLLDAAKILSDPQLVVNDATEG